MASTMQQGVSQQQKTRRSRVSSEVSDARLDEMLKFNNYVQWQRKTVSAADVTNNNASSLSSVSKVMCEKRVDRGRIPGPMSSCSCNHDSHTSKKRTQWPRKTPDSLTSSAHAEKTVSKEIQVLQGKISSAEKSLREHRQRQTELLVANLKLRDELESDEMKMHEDVKQLLRKYEKFRGGMSNMNRRFQEDFKSSKTEIDRHKSDIEDKLTSLEREVEEKSDHLKAKQEELFVLKNYKDKDFPVKSLRITELQRKIELLKAEQEENESEVHRIIESEFDKMQKHEVKTVNEINESVTEEALTRVNPSIRELAVENHSLQNEVRSHMEQIGRLEQNIKSLKSEIRRLRDDPNTDIQRAMFPELFIVRPKCTPDMDVILDIPVQGSLPI